MGRASKFWDRMAGRYARRRIPDQAVYQQKLEVTRRYLTPDSRVLELGCGTGTTAIALAPFAKHIRATDFSPKMLEIASEKAAAQGVDNVSFEWEEAGAPEGPEACFHMVLGHFILHLLEDRQAVMARAFRQLKPGGVFVSTTVVIAPSAWFLGLVLGVGHKVGLLPRIRLIAPQVLLRDMSDAGFSIDHQWQPDRSRTLFVVARKPA